MDFLKKHYEKILLCLVLAGLIGALVFMPFYIASDTAKQNEMANERIHPSVKALTNLDLSVLSNSFERLQLPVEINLNTTNKLFNPVEWEKGPDGLVKVNGGNIGPAAVVVTNIFPLYLVISLDSVITNEFGARYVIGVERQAERQAYRRHKQERYVSPGDKPNDVFELLKVNGAAADPSSLVLKLAGSDDTVTISRDKPYRRVDAYAADFRYDPEKKVFHDRRVGDQIMLNGENYLVTGINTNEVILSDLSNQKKNILPFAR